MQESKVDHDDDKSFYSWVNAPAASISDQHQSNDRKTVE